MKSKSQYYNYNLMNTSKIGVYSLLNYYWFPCHSFILSLLSHENYLLFSIWDLKRPETLKLYNHAYNSVYIMLVAMFLHVNLCPCFFLQYFQGNSTVGDGLTILSCQSPKHVFYCNRSIVLWLMESIIRYRGALERIAFIKTIFLLFKLHLTSLGHTLNEQ